MDGKSSGVVHTLPHSTARLERDYSFGTGHQVANVASHSCWEAHNRINQSERHRYGLLLFLLLVSYLHIFFPPSPTPSHVFSCIYARNVLQNRHVFSGCLLALYATLRTDRANTFNEKTNNQEEGRRRSSVDGVGTSPTGTTN